MEKKILVTGEPHSGKSSLIKRLMESRPHKQGFVSLEIQENGERVGFKIVTAANTEVILASTHLETPIKVSKYCVSVENIERVLPELQQFTPEDLLYIDEIGQMELYSQGFKDLVEAYLNAKNQFVGAISQVYSDEFTRRLLSRDDITVIELTPNNREAVYNRMAELLR